MFPIAEFREILDTSHILHIIKYLSLYVSINFLGSRSSTGLE